MKTKTKYRQAMLQLNNECSLQTYPLIAECCTCIILAFFMDFVKIKWRFKQPKNGKYFKYLEKKVFL